MKPHLLALVVLLCVGALTSGCAGQTPIAPTPALAPPPTAATFTPASAPATAAVLTPASAPTGLPPRVPPSPTLTATPQATSTPTRTRAAKQSFAFGPFHLPSARFGSTFTGTFQAIEPANAREVLEAARQANLRVILNLAGSRRHYQDAGNAFSPSLFQQRLDRFRAFDFAPYVADGTVIGHILFDEPQDPTNWDGKAVPYADIEAAAAYSQQLFPTLPVGAGGPPSFLHTGAPWRSLDFSFAQYTTRRGDIGAWLKQEVNAAQRAGLGLVASLNVLTGNEGAPMTAAQITAWGTVLVNEPGVCAVTMWKYDANYFADPAIAAAMASVTRVAHARAATACRR